MGLDGRISELISLLSCLSLTFWLHLFFQLPQRQHNTSSNSSAKVACSGSKLQASRSHSLMCLAKFRNLLQWRCGICSGLHSVLVQGYKAVSRRSVAPHRRLGCAPNVTSSFRHKSRAPIVSTAFLVAETPSLLLRSFAVFPRGCGAQKSCDNRHLLPRPWTS